MDCSPPGSSGYGISQARILEWFAIFFSRGIFLTQGLNTHLLHWQVDSLLLGHQGSPILPRSLVLSLPQSNCILLGQLYHQLSPAGPQALFIFHFLRLSFYFLVSHHSLQTYPVWPGGSIPSCGKCQLALRHRLSKGEEVGMSRGFRARLLEQRAPSREGSELWVEKQAENWLSRALSIWGVWLIM